MSRTLIASDSFSRADGPVGSNWLNLQPGLNSANVESNQLRANFSDPCPYRWAGSGSFTDDQYSSIAVDNPSTSFDTSNYVGVSCRASSDTDAGRDFYFARVCYDASQTVQVGKIINGTETVLASDATFAWSAGDLLSLEVTGQSPNIALAVLLNLAPISALAITGETSLDTGIPGFYLGKAVGRADNWTSGNVSSGGTLLSVNGIAVAGISKLDLIAYASVKAANGLTTGN